MNMAGEVMETKLMEIPLFVMEQYRVNQWHRYTALTKLDQALWSLDAYRCTTEQQRVKILAGIEQGKFNKTIEEIKNVYRQMQCWENENFVKLYDMHVENVIYAAYDPPCRKFFSILLTIDDVAEIELISRKTGYYEIYEPHFQEQIKKIDLQRNSSIIQKGCLAFPCKSCKTMTCVVQAVYDRSFDEGTTFKAICTVCGKGYRT